MAFCKNCGKEMEEEVKFCPSCGTATNGAELPQQDPSNSQTETAQKKIKEAFQNFNHTADSTEEFDPNDIQTNKGMAILAYFGILFLIPLFVAKDSKFVRFHTGQGINLFILCVAYTVLNSILCGIFYAIAPFLGQIISLLFTLVGLGILVLAILGIINAAQGKAKELPLIGKFRILK